ncbi:MAG TPA: neutral zinc metallopeptidase [Solirubrobacteraceae bacterium]
MTLDTDISARAGLTGLAAIVVLAAALAGCGSGSSSSGASTSTAASAPIEGDAIERLPKVAAATAATSHPVSPGGTGGSTFLRAVFDDVQAMWKREFEAAGMQYTPARLTIFRDQVHTACGTQPASVGPFYCPADRGVYLDTRFFAALSRQVGVHLGDFAQAYVVGHEVGHHVQVLLGISRRVAAADQQDPAGKNPRSVRVELQADCFAGIWKHASYQRNEITAQDFQQALTAAAVVGDDFQQASATGTITPETWTHGSSGQRQHWLNVGFEQGTPSACDTFGS